MWKPTGETCAADCLEGACQPWKSGAWVGSASGGTAIEFQIDGAGNKVTSVKYGWTLCGGGSSTLAGDFAIMGDDFKFTGGTCPTIEITGRLATTEVRGNIVRRWGAACMCAASESSSFMAKAPP